MAREIFFATNRHWDGTEFRLPVDEAQARPLWLGRVSLDGRRVATQCEGTDDFASPEGSCGRCLEAWLAAAQGGLPLLSVHGFQFRFEEAIRRTAEIAAWLEAGQPGLRVVPFLFTWPSSGALNRTAYEKDRIAAKSAGPALGRLLRETAARGAAALQPRLLAHRSGAWALQFGVQAAAPWPGPPLFRDAVLCAADVAADALSDPAALAPLADLAERITVIVNAADPVLEKLSGGLQHQGARLGSDGPPQDRALPPHVRVLDVTMRVGPDPLDDQPVPAGDIQWNYVSHQYYRNEPAVRDALLALLQARALPLPEWRQYKPPFDFAAAPRVAPFYWYLPPP